MTKTCRKCGYTGPLDDFPTDNSKKDGRHSLCKVCKGLTEAKWAKAHRDKKNANWKRWAERQATQRGKDGKKPAINEE